MSTSEYRKVTWLRQGLLAFVVAGALGAGTMPVFAQDADLSTLSGEIVSDGSSTVGPLTQAVAEEFNGQAPDVQISVDISGTGGGFERFCAGETDVQNASRAIEEDEIASCAENGVDWYEFEVAYDGLTVVTNPENTWLTCATTDQLKQLWQKEGPANTWADLNPEYPADTINLYGPGTDSGTFDFFVETILGEDEIRGRGYQRARLLRARLLRGESRRIECGGNRQRRWNLCDAQPGDGAGWDVRAAFTPALCVRDS
jgi:phosphate transport system substrate-binding protein